MPRLLPSLLLLLSAAGAPALQAQEPVVVVTAKPAPPDCVEVNANGRREQSLACLNEKLMPASPATGQRPPQLSGAQAVIAQPSNQLGLYNRAALEHRMGNTFGKSVVPQRPATPPPASPLVPVR